MQHAHSSPIPAQATGARAAVTGAASSPAMAALVGSLFDFLYTVRRGHADAAATAPVLLRLSADGPMRACDLAEHLHLDQSTVSRHVASLEAEGLLRREPHDLDRRAHLVGLTPEGRAAASAKVSEGVRRFESVVADWPAEDVTELTRLLSTFVHGLDAHERTPE